jgi:hypothetical protein
MPFFVLLVILSAAPALQAAQVYYVDTGGSNTTGDGSISKPWRSLEYAADQVPGGYGHTIHLNAGTFLETNQIIIEPGVNIEGSGKANTIVQRGQGGWFMQLESETVTNGNQTLSNFSVDGLSKQQSYGILVRGRHNVVVHDVDFKDIDTVGLQICAEWGPDEYSGPSTYLQGIEVYNCSFKNCAKDYGSSSEGCMQIGHLEGALIHDITINEDRGYGIKYTQGGWLKGIKVYNCNITVPSYDPAWGSDIAMELWQVYDDCEVYNNVSNNWFSFVRGNKGSGTLALRAHDNVILFERADNPKEAFEVAHGLCDVEIYDNYVRHPSKGVAIWGRAGEVQHNIFVHNNVFYDHSDGDGMVIAPSGSGCDYSDIRVYNNVFDGLSSAALLGTSEGGKISGVQIKNNIIINCNRVIATMAEGSTVSNTLVEYNCINNVGSFIEEWGDDSVNSVFRNNIESSPQISGSGNRPYPYYAPSSGTSAIVDAGTNVGLPYAGTAPDIGVYEYGEIVNSAPVVNAGQDQEVAFGNPANLTGSVSDDGLPNPPGTTTCAWSVVSGPGTVTFGDENSVSTSASFSELGSYTLRLTADDGEFQSSDDINVSVTSGGSGGTTNTAPVVNAGWDQIIDFGTAAALSGSVTDDGLPNPPAFTSSTWSVVGGPGTVTFTDPNAASTSAYFSELGSYVLRLTADDREFQTSDDITVSVGYKTEKKKGGCSLGFAPPDISDKDNWHFLGWLIPYLLLLLLMWARKIATPAKRCLNMIK